jgi:hypothetical protein
MLLLLLPQLLVQQPYLLQLPPLPALLLLALLQLLLVLL